MSGAASPTPDPDARLGRDLREPISQLPEHPRRIDGFFIEDELGRGGMGVVYAARDPELDRRLALKLIGPAAAASGVGLDRFAREVQAVAKLRHPNIVTLHHHGLYQGRPYYVMDLVEGESLAERLRREGPCEPRAAATLAERLARALDHAHRRGVLHRDVKPGNVLLDAEAQPLLADFGLARPLEATSDITATGALVGTPTYMAPEQARGEPLDARADVYALGATLYHLLTGRPPFAGAGPAAVVHALLHHTPASPRALRPQLDRDLETICLHCLERTPAERYPSALDLAQDLERWLGGHPIRARRPTRVERLLKWARREPARALGLGVLIVAIVSALVAARVAAEQTRRLERRRGDLLDQAATRALEGQDAARAAAFTVEALAIEETAERVRRLSAAKASWWSRRLLEGHWNGVRAVASSPQDDLLASAGWGDGTVRLWRAGRLERVLPTYQRQPVDLAFSPSGRYLAMCPDPTHYCGQVLVWDLDAPANADPLQYGVPGSVLEGRPRAIAWHPREDRLAVLLTRGVALLNPTAPEAPRVLEADTRLAGLGWSPDGDRLACGASTGEVWLWDPERPEATPLRRRLHDRPIAVLAWSSDGRLATGGSDGSLAVHRPGEEDALSVPRAHRERITALAWSADGEFLASASTDTRVRLWRPPDPQPFLVLADHRAHVYVLRWSPQGRRLASGDRDGLVRIRDFAGEPSAVTLRAGRWRVWDLAWSAGGEALVGAAGWCVWVWRPCPAPRLATIPTSVALNEVFAWSPTAPLLAAAQPDGRLAMWDGHGPARDPGAPPDPLRHLPGHAGTPRAVAWCGDGSRLASGDAAGELRVTDPQAGRSVVLSTEGSGVVALAWRDDRRLACAREDASVSLHDPSRPEEAALVLSPEALPPGERPRGPPSSVAWSGRGSLALFWADGTVVLWWPDTPSRPPCLLPRRPRAAQRGALPAAADSCRPPPGSSGGSGWPWRDAAGHRDVGGMSWSPSGLQLAVTSDEHGVVVWDLSGPSPRCWWPEVPPQTHPWGGIGEGVAWGPTGLLCVTLDRRLLRWDTTSSPPSLVSDIEVGQAIWRYGNSVSLSPTDAAAAVSNNDYDLQLVDPQRRQPLLALLKEHSRSAWRAAWSRQGRFVSTGAADGHLIVWDARLRDPARRRRLVRRVTGLQVQGLAAQPIIPQAEAFAEWLAGDPPRLELGDAPGRQRLEETPGWRWHALRLLPGQRARVSSGGALRTSTHRDTGQSLGMSSFQEKGDISVPAHPEHETIYLRVAPGADASPPLDYLLWIEVEPEPEDRTSGQGGRDPQETPSLEVALGSSPTSDAPERVVARVAGDEFYLLFVGRRDGTGIRLIGSAASVPEGLDRGIETVHEFQLLPSETVYCAVWDREDTLMLCGSFRGSRRGELVTAPATWECLLAAGPNPHPGTPSRAALTAEIRGGGFLPARGRPRYLWGVFPELQGRAEFLYYDTLRARSFTDRSFVIFRPRAGVWVPRTDQRRSEAASER